MSGYSAEVIARFWSKVDKSPDPDGCWLWTGSTDTAGYGHLGFTTATGKRHVKAHRFVWELEHGPIPKGLCVLHKPPCITRRCVRHLYLGTYKQNTADARAMQRAPQYSRPGEQNNLNKYPVSVIIALREAYARGDDYRALGAHYGMKPETARGIVTPSSRTWKHVTMPPITHTKNPHSPFTLEQIQALRTGFMNWHGSIRSYAKHLDMNYMTVYAIIKRKNWKNA